MTVTSSVNKQFYTGNGSVTTFAINSLSGDVLTGLTIFDDDDVKVYLDGVLKTKTTHYTISSTTPPASFAGKLVNANVVFLTAPANGVAVAIVRDIPVTQDLLLSNGNNVPPKPLESQLDKIVVQNQQLAGTLVVDVVRIGGFESASGIDPITIENDKYLKWVGGQLTNADPVAIGVDISNATVTQVATNTANIATNTSSINTLNTVKNPTVTGNALKYARVNAEETAYEAVNLDLPNGYLNAPVPTYDSAQPKQVNFNGALTARTQDNTENVVLSSASRNLDLATNGANGLADGLTVANNTWYYVYAYSGGYVASTTNGASTLTIDTVVQKVVQLPLTLRTDGSANILPFTMTQWRGKSSSLRYTTTLTGTTLGLTGTTTLVGLAAGAGFLPYSLASFVPPASTSATLFNLARGGGAFNIRPTGGALVYSYDKIGTGYSRELITQTNASQSVDVEATVSGADIAVLGYSINL
jgi:hypothetical protein